MPQVTICSSSLSDWMCGECLYCQELRLRDLLHQERERAERAERERDKLREALSRVNMIRTEIIQKYLPQAHKKTGPLRWGRNGKLYCLYDEIRFNLGVCGTISIDFYWKDELVCYRACGHIYWGDTINLNRILGRFEVEIEGNQK